MIQHKTSAVPEGLPGEAIQLDPILEQMKQGHTLLASRDTVCLFNKSNIDMIAQLPLPGLVIFVHGVNSDGEWYDETEEGLCAGLNERLARRDKDLAFTGADAGQLTPMRYMHDLTDDGYLNPDLKPDTFIVGDTSFSPVIRFRWGYKANGEELQKYGAGIYLNERDYWGGGPFANGCTTLPDLWGEGLSDQLFLWLHIQHMNPTNDRQVYSCPPRPYYVLAALRLARLVETLRKAQADVPITIVCHSQGNMIGMAAAFLGDRLTGKSGVNCVADSYVLCNPPYSLVADNFSENMTQGGMKDSENRTGRQTGRARAESLKAFFKIIAAQKSRKQDDTEVDRRMANQPCGFSIARDRERHGYQGSTYGRVTLYFNPHDQVISATSVQGIGWRGMSQEEIGATGGAGVFSQRVFAQGFVVGAEDKKFYDGWKDHWRGLKGGDKQYWFPESKPAEYSLSKGLQTNATVLGAAATVMTWPIFKLALGVFKVPINAYPPKTWVVPLEAPPLRNGVFVPQAKRFGVSSDQFDQGFDAPGQSRDMHRARDANDPYGDATPIPRGGSQGKEQRQTDAALGDRHSEASLRYEHHGQLRMQARRDRLHPEDQKASPEDNLEKAGADYQEWRGKQIRKMLAANVDSHATDHSTIMTNGMHAQKALTYDVTIGCCEIRKEVLHEARKAADWRLVKGLGKDNPNKLFEEYFEHGYFKELPAFDWAKTPGGEGSMPTKIIDERQRRPARSEGLQ